MGHSSRDQWKYIAAPVKTVVKVDEIVAADRYPEGYWHSRDHFVIECLKWGVKHPVELKRQAGEAEPEK